MAKTFNLIGIDTTQIGKVQEVITSYIDALETCIGSVKASKENFSGAIKGEGRKLKMKNILEKIRSNLNQTVNTLAKFNDKLDLIAQQYKNEDSAYKEAASNPYTTSTDMRS